MATIYLILEISALLLVIILPLAGPKKKKNVKVNQIEISDWAINENGDLENYTKSKPAHQSFK